MSLLWWLADSGADGPTAVQTDGVSFCANPVPGSISPSNTLCKAASAPSPHRPKPGKQSPDQGYPTADVQQTFTSDNPSLPVWVRGAAGCPVHVSIFTNGVTHQVGMTNPYSSCRRLRLLLLWRPVGGHVRRVGPGTVGSAGVGLRLVLCVLVAVGLLRLRVHIPAVLLCLLLLLLASRSWAAAAAVVAVAEVVVVVVVLGRELMRDIKPCCHTHKPQGGDESCGHLLQHWAHPVAHHRHHCQHKGG